MLAVVPISKKITNKEVKNVGNIDNYAFLPNKRGETGDLPYLKAQLIRSPADPRGPNLLAGYINLGQYHKINYKTVTLFLKDKITMEANAYRGLRKTIGPLCQPDQNIPD